MAHTPFVLNLDSSIPPCRMLFGTGRRLAWFRPSAFHRGEMCDVAPACSSLPSDNHEATQLPVADLHRTLPLPQ